MTKKKERLGSDPFNSVNDELIDGENGTERVLHDDKEPVILKPEITAVVPVQIVDNSKVEEAPQSAAAEEKPVEKMIEETDREVGKTSCKGKNVLIHIDSTEPGFVTFTIQGEVTIYSVNDIYTCIREFMNGTSSMDLDLSGVHKIDSAGYQLISLIKKESVNTGRLIKFSNPNNEIKRIFRLFGEQI